MELVPFSTAILSLSGLRWDDSKSCRWVWSQRTDDSYCAGDSIQGYPIWPSQRWCHAACGILYAKCYGISGGRALSKSCRGSWKVVKCGSKTISGNAGETNLQAQLEARPDEDTLLNHAKSWSYDFYTNLIHWHACNFKTSPFGKSYYKPLSITITSRHWYHLSDRRFLGVPLFILTDAILQWSEDRRSEDSNQNKSGTVESGRCCHVYAIVTSRIVTLYLYVGCSFVPGSTCIIGIYNKSLL